MEKRKRWHFYLILAVVVLTLINIAPTIIYYSKPLDKQIDKPRAMSAAKKITDRVNSLETQSHEWLQSFTSHLGLKPTSIQLKSNDPNLFVINFQDKHDANIFKRFLPKAGTLIPFVPAQLELYPGTAEDSNKVLVARQIGVHLNPKKIDKYFTYIPKIQNGKISKGYQNLIYNRAERLALSFGGTTDNALFVSQVVNNKDNSQREDDIISKATEIVEVTKALGNNSPTAKRYYATFSQTDISSAKTNIDAFVSTLAKVNSSLKSRIDNLSKEEKSQKEQGFIISEQTVGSLALLKNHREKLDQAQSIIKNNLTLFKSGKKPLTSQEIKQMLTKGGQELNPKDPVQTINLDGRNPFVKTLIIDWGNNTIETQFFNDVQTTRLTKTSSEKQAFEKEMLNQLIMSDIARVARKSDESFNAEGDEFVVTLTELTNPQSFLSFNLGYIAAQKSQQLVDQLKNTWQPKHPDLERQNYPIMAYDTYKTLKPEDQRLGLLIYAPAMYSESTLKDFNTDSIYVVARGLNTILQKYRQAQDAPGSEALRENIEQLTTFLRSKGFIGYPGKNFGQTKEFDNDFIFELDDYYTNLISATRENFQVKGDNRFAVLDFTDVEQRITTLNEIQNKIHENLLQSKDEYDKAQVSIDSTKKYEVPPPIGNVYWDNFKLSLAKYFRGDRDNVLKWGLDLSGGKTVRVGLRDQNNKPVTDQQDLNQAVGELNARVNKMGVSERAIRIVGDTIVLDFPGSQALSAQELIRASAMYFHIFNEKFSTFNPELSDSVNRFLQNVWNEAVVTNRKDMESINQIAWQHLGGDNATGDINPRSEIARTLVDNGLKLANPSDQQKSNAFNDTISMVAKFRGDEISEWYGQTHPLTFVFRNYALEGANLTDIRAGYDASKGNFLIFSVKRSYEKAPGSPREDLYNWTSQFAQDQIAGTPKEAYSRGRGWRMGVILNDEIITQPTLNAAIRDGGTIEGRFTGREISQLTSDLKAGSLSFTPYILSEQNVSPELGQAERTRGIIASVVGLILVGVAMIGYYRFAGLVATCAVVLNLLIMWAVLQSIDAALTLPGIAGIVLTIGMAVDANVLVFERIREEFKVSGRISSAIQAGYKKAYSAIIDSNVTTIVAALILTQFDSGPIKGFAVTLIIGLVSSMFTALFVTRYFFAGWVQNPKHKELNMSQFIGETKIDFLKHAKKAIFVSVAFIVIGTFFFINERKTLFGMDFTGGYSLTVELEEKQGVDDYRTLVQNALITAGAKSTDVQVQELSFPNQVRIQLGMGMEESGRPFYKLPEFKEVEKVVYSYQTNPRIEWLVAALNKGGVNIQKSDLDTLNKDWTMMSGQFSESMRHNATFALSLALAFILLYITVRFEFKYAISSVVALAHDVIVTIGILAFFHFLGMPVTIDLTVVGAIMTIIGYSLNDTIVVFDRIREDIKLYRKWKFEDIINYALNITLGRTLMTSGTTLLVLLSLVFLGGHSIFDFSLVMTIGVIVGTFSSLFIASPIMLFFHNREEKQPSKAKA